MVPPPRAAVNRLRLPVASPSDPKPLIEPAVNRFLDEVPALQPLKLVAGLELRGGRDLQIYRVELPGPKVSKDLPADAKVTLHVNRAQFNELATKGHIKDWRAGFEHGGGKGTGKAQGLTPLVNTRA